MVISFQKFATFGKVKQVVINKITPQYFDAFENKISKKYEKSNFAQLQTSNFKLSPVSSHPQFINTSTIDKPSTNSVVFSCVYFRGEKP
jgi:hypothetical protein